MVLLPGYTPIDNPRSGGGSYATDGPSSILLHMTALIEADAAIVAALPHDRAEQMVRKLEEDDVRAAHLFLREIGRTGQPPLSLELVGSVQRCPLRVGTTPEKFRLEVASTADLERWELGRRREEDAAHQRLLWEASGAQQLTLWCQDQGVSSWSALDWGRIVQP
jgi:hypothetical protein